MRSIALTLLILAVPAMAAPEVYRWVDEDGTVHYSDEPIEGAERVRLWEAQTYPAPTPASRARGEDDGTVALPDPAFGGYQSIRITAPEDDSVVWVTGGLMQATVALEPGLQPGHRVVLLVNGSRAGSPVAGTTVSATGMIRGTHQLEVAVLDAEGTELIRSDSVSIHARAHSVHGPQRK